MIFETDLEFNAGGGLVRRQQQFLSSGSFTVPDGVTRLYITACGGGSGGSVANQTYQPPTKGGDTSFGTIITCKGGSAEIGGTVVAPATCLNYSFTGGNGGAGRPGSGSGAKSGGASISYAVNSGTYNSPDTMAGGGGASAIADGGHGSAFSSTSGVAGFGAGSGGCCGKGGNGSPISGQGGGGAGALVNAPIDVNAGDVYLVTIGAGSQVADNTAGGPGMVLVEWEEYK